MRAGSRRIMLGALTAFCLFAALHLAVAWFHGETLVGFVILQALTMACFGLISANLGALAMEPLGHIAGTASSVQGLITTIGGALIGLLIGQSFDGTTIPFLIGFTLCGAAALGVAWWTNRPEPRDRRAGRLTQKDPPSGGSLKRGRRRLRGLDVVLGRRARPSAPRRPPRSCRGSPFRAWPPSPDFP